MASVVIHNRRTVEHKNISARWQIGGRCGSQPGRKGAILPRRTVAKKPRNRKELHMAGGTVLESSGLSDRRRARRI